MKRNAAYGLFTMSSNLFQRRHGNVVHVREGLIFPGHPPDEGVAAGPHPRMDGPTRRDDGLFVPDNDMPRLLRLPHEVENYGIGRHIEIEVYLHPPVVGVAGDPVPVSARPPD